MMRRRLSANFAKNMLRIDAIIITEWHCYHFIFILYSVFDVVMVFNQLFLVYETMMIQCMLCTCTLIPCNGVDREINSILFYSIKHATAGLNHQFLMQQVY